MHLLGKRTLVFANAGYKTLCNQYALSSSRHCSEIRPPEASDAMDEELCEEPSELSTWSADQLIARVKSLEQQLKDQTAKYTSITLSSRTPSPARKIKNARVNRVFDPSKYSSRPIALKFAYLGQRYNGLEYHTKNKTPLRTIEEELWKALNKARLVFPTPNPLLEPDEPNWEGCEYSKCGRTDKGVSAFGQVVGIRVRSNCPVNRAPKPPLEEAATEKEEISYSRYPETAAPTARPVTSLGEDAIPTLSTNESGGDEISPFHHIKDEIPYCQVLNKLLPPDIRMLAWCPTPPLDFSARFACKERRYRYFFTQPAFTSTIGSAGLLSGLNKSDSSVGRRREGWLDIDAMRQAAHRFIGLHDFRNFCKVDPSKQIENFERRIFHADIEEMDSQRDPVGYVGNTDFQQYEQSHEAPGWDLDNDLKGQSHTPTIYTFTLHGSGFLWHQVRHMVAILFLVGQGLEPPSLIDDLLDVSKTPARPQYEMADDAPLVLSDCIFPREGADSKVDALDWVYVDDGTDGAGKGSSGGLLEDLWKVWRARKIEEVLAGTLLDVAVSQRRDHAVAMGKSPTSQKVFQGGDAPRSVGTYVPVMQKPRMDTVETMNARYARRKGFETGEEERGRGFRRLGGGAEGGDV